MDTNTSNEDHAESRDTGNGDTLAAMFPDIPRETIDSVLKSNNGDPDLTAAFFLQDDSGNNSNSAVASDYDHAHAKALQEAEDAAYARQLASESQPPPQQQDSDEHHYPLNYVPRQRRSQQQQQQSTDSENKGKDELDQMMEQMKIAAKVSKDTAMNWFTKAKAKAQEYQQNFAANQSGTPGSSSATATDYDAPAAGYYESSSTPTPPKVPHSTPQPAAHVQPTSGKISPSLLTKDLEKIVEKGDISNTSNNNNVETSINNSKDITPQKEIKSEADNKEKDQQVATTTGSETARRKLSLYGDDDLKNRHGDDSASKKSDHTNDDKIEYVKNPFEDDD